MKQAATSSKVSTSYVAFFLIFLSAFFAYLIAVTFAFPYLGFAVVFSGLASCIFFYKKPKDATSITLFVLALLTSFFLVYRVQVLLTFFNFVATIYLISALVLYNPNRKWRFFDSAISPLLVLLETFYSKDELLLGTNKTVQQTTKKINRKSVIKLVVSLSIALLILVIIVPLLAYSNPIFRDLVEWVIDFFNIDRILELIFTQAFVELMWAAFFFVMFLLLLPRALSFVKTAKTAKFYELKLSTISDYLLIPKIITIAVLAIFFITQLQLYFSSPEVLELLNYSNSRYAREVFAHLCIVSLIIFALIYNEKNSSRAEKTTTWLLVIEGIFLTFVAMKSVFDYTSMWGFTHNRLYGYVLVLYTFGIYMFYCFYFIENLTRSKLVKYIVIFTGVVLVLVNIMNFDYLIFHYAKSTPQEGKDNNYLSRLSPDAKSYKTHLKTLEFETQHSGYNQNKGTHMYRLVSEIESLRDKYEDLDIRTFNFSEYFAYVETKDLDIDYYYVFIDRNYNIYNRTQINDQAPPMPIR